MKFKIQVIFFLFVLTLCAQNDAKKYDESEEYEYYKKYQHRPKYDRENYMKHKYFKENYEKKYNKYEFQPSESTKEVEKDYYEQKYDFEVKPSDNRNDFIKDNKYEFQPTDDNKKEYHDKKYNYEIQPSDNANVFIKDNYEKRYKYQVQPKDVFTEENYKKKYNKYDKQASKEVYDKKYNAGVQPPDHTKVIAMARFVVHQSDWTSVATLSTLPSLKGYPFTNVVSMSDGPVENSTGIPYFYLTPLDFTARDLEKDNRCTISVTLQETDYCNQQNLDPEDPRCARVMLSGKIKKIYNNSGEYEFAKNALFTRHPSMATLPEDHHFFVAKLKISQIAMLDWFGGPKYIDVQDYLAFKPDEKSEKSSFDTFVDTNSLDESIKAIQF